MTSPRVRFVIGGAQKSGTTALARYLAQHPGVRLPTAKEAHVFDAPDFNDRLSPAEIDARYVAHFTDGDVAALHGDATPIYMLRPALLDRIKRYNPAMRWIILLRDPIDRAISHYHMERARGLETWPMLPAFLFERWRLAGHLDDLAHDSPLRTHSYRLRGDYATQLDALHARFDSSQVLLLRNDELRHAPHEVLNRVYGFLGIGAPARLPDVETVFEGRYPPPSRLVRAVLAGLLYMPRRRLAARHGIRF